MKKIAIFIFLFIITIVVLHKVEISKRDKVSSLLLHNIEALAADEDNGVNSCFGVGSVDCPTSHTKILWYTSGYSIEVSH